MKFCSKSLLLIYTFILLTIPSTSMAQVDWDATAFIQPFPSPYLSDWESNPNIGWLRINNYTGVEQEIRIYLTLSREDGEFIGSASSEPVAIAPSPPVTEFNNTTMVDYDDTDYDETIEDDIIRTGRLPEGSYTACIELKDMLGNVLLEGICAEFTILYPDPPYLIYPLETDTIYTRYPLFQWIPVQVPPDYQLHYVFRMAEILPGQVPSEALAANIPHYENYDILTPYLQYPIDAQSLESGKSYVWQVQALDQNGYPPSSNQGKSEIWTFTYSDSSPFDEEEEDLAKRGISGIVRNLITDEPISRARLEFNTVTAVIKGDSIIYVKDPNPVTAFSGEDGSFLFDGVPDSTFFVITASKKSFILNETYGLEQFENGEIEGFDIYMTPGYADISGRIFQKHYNVPLQDIVLELWEDVQDGANGGSGENVARRITSARTDSAGNFILYRIMNGDNYFITITDPLYADFTSPVFSVSGPFTNDIGPFYLTPKYGTIEGTVSKFGSDSLISNAAVYIYADSTVPDSGETNGYGQPLTEPLFGPDTTDHLGEFNFESVPVNVLYQVTDRYIIGVEANGYYSDYLPARITEKGLTATVDFSLLPVLGTIQGMVTSSIDGSAVYNAKVELQSLEFAGADSGGQPRIRQTINGPVFNTVKTAFTNPDGTYALSNITAGSYDRVLITKINYEDFIAEGPISISNGQVVTLDAILQRPTGTIFGVITDDLNEPIFAVAITSPDVPGISEYSQADGSFWIANAPSGEVRLEFNFPGYSVVTDTVNVVPNDTSSVEVTMTGYRGSITIFVKDSLYNSAIAGAAVILQGEDPDTTDITGAVILNNVPVGSKTLSIVPPISDPVDYLGKNTNIEIENGPNSPLTLKLLRGGRISGTVVLEGSGSAIPGAQVRIEGINNIDAITDGSGQFSLRNVPADDTLTLIASKTGYRNDRSDDIVLSVGQHLENVRLELQESPLDSVFGFAVEVDSIIDLTGGNKRVIGALVDIPANPALEMQNQGQRIHFDSLIVNSSYEPISSSFVLDIAEIPVLVFGKFESTLKDTSGAFLRAGRVDSLGTGEIRGDIVLENAIPLWIPGADWANEKIERDIAPAFWADGAYHGQAGQNFGLTVTGNTVSARFWGFSITIDYAQTGFDSAGFHYYGALQFPRLSREIQIENLNIRKNENSGRLEFVSVTVSTDPPIEIPLGLFTVIDSSATWNQSGFRANGAIDVDQLDREFGFEDLRISTDGDFLSVTVTADSSSGTINVLSADFTIQSIGFGTDDSSNVRFFTFSGAMGVPNIDEPIEFQNLKFTENGDFSGTIQFNQEKTIAGVLTIQMQAVEFDEDSNGKYIFFMAGIAFEIPSLSVQAGNIRLYENGDFNIERIEIAFVAGPAEVAVSAEWSNNVFAGSGSITVQPAFTAAAQFRYGGTSDWWIQITANTNIPVGAITIVSVTGEIGYQYGTWIFGFGGGFSTGNLEDAIRFDLYVQVHSTPEGPIINGNATVIAMSGMEIGEATICLDFVNDRFTGNILFGFDRSGVTVSAQIDVDVKQDHYWYVGGAVNIDFFSLAQLNSTLALGNNYDGWSHELPVAYHPDNQTLNGFHADLTFHQGASGWQWSLSVDTWAYILINWNGDLAAGIRLYVNGYFDLWIIGGSAQVNLEAAIQSVNNCLSLHGGADVQLKLWIGCCGSGSRCWRPCWAWIFPCGFTACFGIDVSVDYNCSSGWDFNVDI